MKRALCVVLALLLVVPLAPTPAQAGCCDDFWSCLGAVVTAGVSCAVEAAIDAVSNFIKSIETARENGRKEMEAAFEKQKEVAREGAEEVREKMKELLSQMQKHEADARKMAQSMTVLATAKAQSIKQTTAVQSAQVVKQAPGSGAAKVGAAAPASGTQQPQAAAQSAQKVQAQSGLPKVPATPQPTATAAQAAHALKLADADRTRQAMEKGAQEVRKKRDEMANQRKKALDQKAAQSEAEANQRVAGLRTLLNAVFLAPLAGMLATLVVGDPIAMAASLAVMATQLDNIKKALDTQMDPAVAKAAGDTEKKLAEMEKEAGEAAKEREKAKRTVELMQKLQQSKHQADLEALEKHLGITHLATSAMAHATMQATMAQKVAFKSTAVVMASKEHALVATRKLKTDLDQPIALARTIERPTAPAVAAFQPRVTADLNAHFQGRSPADMGRKRDELIAEARRRLARDPKTLEAVEKYLREQAAARGVR